MRELTDFRCVEMVEETMYGQLRKHQLVKHWEGKTMNVDITRKIPPGEEVWNAISPAIRRPRSNRKLVVRNQETRLMQAKLTVAAVITAGIRCCYSRPP